MPRASSGSRPYLGGRAPLRLCVFIVDARHEPTDRDLALQGWLDHHGLPYLVAANKIDALSRSDAKRREQALARGRDARAVLAVSAERGTGLDTLWNTIRGAAFGPPAPAPERQTIDEDDDPLESKARRHDG